MLNSQLKFRRYLIFNFLSPFLVSRQRNLSFSCVETHTFPVFFNATSFLQLPGRAGHNTISLGFQFRTWNSDGLLVFSNLDDGTLEISLEDSRAVVRINVTKATGNNRVDLTSGESIRWQWGTIDVLRWSLVPLLASLFLSFLDFLFFFSTDTLIYSVQCCFNRPLCPGVGIITRLPLRLIELEPAITSVLLKCAHKHRLAHSSTASLRFDSVISISQ